MSQTDNYIRYISLLGKGRFGEVYLSTIEGRNKYFAIKRLKREQMDTPKFNKYLKNEIENLQKLNHKNICKYEDFIKTKNHYLIVMEYINGGLLSDFFERYKQKYNKSSFQEEIVQYIMKQVISAFKYIHGKGIIHRDIRLENIMLNFSNEKDKNDLNILKATIKIIDFGSAIKSFAKTILEIPQNMQNMDPHLLKKYQESLQNNNPYDVKADIWSLGAICYQMLIGKPVFDGKSLNDLIRKVEEGTYPVPTTLSYEIISFLNAMLKYKPEKRKTAEELLEHKFLTKDIREFRKINLKKASKQMGNNRVNINIKQNNNLWSIYSYEDSNRLSNIKGEYEDYPKKIQQKQGANGFQYCMISNNSSLSNSHFEPKIQNYNYNYMVEHQIPFNCQNIQNIQNKNIGRIPQKSYQSISSSNTIYPSKEYYNSYDINQNIAKQTNKANIGCFMGYNNKNNNNIGCISNSQNTNRPMNKVESEEDNVCFIM